MIAAKNAVMDSFGIKIDDLIVEQVLRNGTADISKPYLDCIATAAKRYVADIFATLRKYEYNPDLMRLYIVGGEVAKLLALQVWPRAKPRTVQSCGLKRRAVRLALSGTLATMPRIA